MRICPLCQKPRHHPYDEPFSPRKSLDPIGAAKLAALRLYQEIEKDLGEKIARSIFKIWGTPPTPRKIARTKNFLLLLEYDDMKPKPNAKKLARSLAANGGGPRGSRDPVVIERHLRRLIADRKKGMEAGTWWGPFPL
jgi:hypothetical protein